MEEDYGGQRSDTDVSVPMAPGVSSSPATLVSNAHQVSLPKHSILGVGDKSDSGVLSSEVPKQVIVLAEKPAEASEDGGILLADGLKAYDKVGDYCMGAGVDVQEVSTLKETDITESRQDNSSLDNGAMVKENGTDVKDLGVSLPDSLDDDQPLCMVFRKGKLGEDALVSLVGRKPTEERTSSPQIVLPSSVSSPGMDKVKASIAECAEGVVKKIRHSEGGVVKSVTLKSRPNSGLERSSRRGSMEARRAPRHAKKRRYCLCPIVYFTGNIQLSPLLCILLFLSLLWITFERKFCFCKDCCVARV